MTLALTISIPLWAIGLIVAAAICFIGWLKHEDGTAGPFPTSNFAGCIGCVVAIFVVLVFLVIDFALRLWGSS